jgi:hypothetical protein
VQKWSVCRSAVRIVHVTLWDNRTRLALEHSRLSKQGPTDWALGKHKARYGALLAVGNNPTQVLLRLRIFFSAVALTMFLVQPCVKQKCDACSTYLTIHEVRPRWPHACLKSLRQARDICAFCRKESRHGPNVTSYEGYVYPH